MKRARSCLMQGRQDFGIKLQATVAYAFETTHFFGNRPQCMRRTLYEHDLKALMIFKMDELDGNNFLEALVLEISEAVLQIPFAMIVDEAKQPHHHGVIAFTGLDD